MKFKRYFAFILSFILAIGSVIPALAYSDSVLTGDYVSVGDNELSVSDTQIVSIYYFTASAVSDLGTYRVTTNDPQAVLRSYCGTIGFRYDNTDDTDYDSTTNSYTFTVTSVGAKYLIGVKGAFDFTLNIEKVSDYTPPSYLNEKFTTLTHYDYIKRDYIIPDDATRTYVDVTVPHTLVEDNYGRYHLDSIEGPILYVDIYNTPYINLYSMAQSGMLRCYRYYGSGNHVIKSNYSKMYLEYEFYADPTLGIYPLDFHLRSILKDVGNANGWYDKDRELGYYIFGDTEVCEESAFLFCAFYFDDETQIKYAGGSQTYPYSLVCNNPNGNFCEINRGSSSFFSLDVYENTEVSCIAIAPDLSVYTGYKINYADKTYTPKKDGIITFTTDGLTNLLKVSNSGTQKYVTFFLVLSTATAKLYGNGSAASPYQLTCDSPAIPACTLAKNSSLHFKANLTKETYVIATASNEDLEPSPDIYASYDGKLYYPNPSGILVFPLSRKCDNFEIFNTANKKLTLNIILVSDISFLTPKGSYENPNKISSGDHTAKISDVEQGLVYYAFTANNPGVLELDFLSSSTEGFIYTVTNTATGEATEHVYSDGASSNLTLKVKTGDTFLIGVGTYDTHRFWYNPIGEVDWSLTYKPYIKGDINLDFTRNAMDANLLKRIISGELSVDNFSDIFSVIDINPDGNINAVDSYMLIKRIIGDIK